MNTILSAMAIDYPPEKLSVYLSDDAASSLKVYGIREAWRFAVCWVPFCRKYGIKTTCPRTYFQLEDINDHGGCTNHFFQEKESIQLSCPSCLQISTTGLDSGDYPPQASHLGSLHQTQPPAGVSPSPGVASGAGIYHGMPSYY